MYTCEITCRFCSYDRIKTEETMAIKNITRVKGVYTATFAELDKGINAFLDDKDINVIGISLSTKPRIPDGLEYHYALITYKLSYDCKCLKD